MDSLPPIQRSLLRQQIFFPMSLLLLAASVLISQLVAHPTLREVNDEWVTLMTPNSMFIVFYWSLLFLLLIGQGVLLLTVRNSESLAMLTSGVGLRLVAINLIMIAWVQLFTFQWWKASWFCLVAVSILALWTGFALWGYPPSRSRPVEFLTVHVPVRMLLAVLFSVDLWQNGLLALGYFSRLGEHWENNHKTHVWIVTGVILGVNVLTALEVFFMQDVVWAVSSIYLSVGVALHYRGKPVPVMVAIIFGAVLVLVALLASVGWSLMKRDREGAVRLEGEEGEGGGTVAEAEPEAVVV